MWSLSVKQEEISKMIIVHPLQGNLSNSYWDIPLEQLHTCNKVLCTLPSFASSFSLLPFPFHSTDYLIIHPSLCWNGVLILSICVRHCWGSKGKACHSLFTPPLHFNSSPTKPWIWFHSALKSKISLQTGAPPGLRQQEEVGQVPGSVERGILEILGHSEMNECVN